jgi:hypothetical protein
MGTLAATSGLLHSGESGHDKTEHFQLLENEGNYILGLMGTDKNIGRYQVTAVDAATHVRALKTYRGHTKAKAIEFVESGPTQ